MIEQRYLFVEGSKIHNEFLADLIRYSVTYDCVRGFRFVSVYIYVPDDTSLVFKLKYSKYLDTSLKVTILKPRKFVDTKDSFQVKYD